MNASDQAKGLKITTKIASIVNLFKQYFPDVKADLKPWHNDPDTINLIDPDSIDIAFHFPGWSHKIQSRSILVQIRFRHDLEENKSSLIGLETAGFNYSGEVWRFSTVDNWPLEGNCLPKEEVTDKLKEFCREVFLLFSEDLI